MTDAAAVSSVHWRWISSTRSPPEGLNTALVEERPVKASQKPVRSCYHLWNDGEGRWVPESDSGSPIPDEDLRVGDESAPGKYHSYYIAKIKLVCRHA